MLIVIFPLILFIPIVIFARQVHLVRSGRRGGSKATLMLLIYSVFPVSAYSLLFLAMVALEELLKVPIVDEGISRTLLLIDGIGLIEALVLTAGFAITLRFLNVGRAERPDSVE